MFRLLSVGTVLSLCLCVRVGAQAPLTLSDAIERAVQRHPLLHAARFEIDARADEVSQVRRWLNPLVEVEAEDLGRAGRPAGPAETTVSVAQRLEIGGKRAARTVAALADRGGAEGDALVARHQLAGRVAVAFVRVLAASVDVALAGEDAATAAEVATAIAARVDAGVAPPPDADRAQADALAAQIRQRDAAVRLRSARLELAGAWAGGLDDVGLLSGELRSVAVPPLDTLLARRDAAPAVVIEQAGVEQARAGVGVARAARVPDLDVRFGYRRLHETGTSSWIAAAGASLPLFDRGRDRLAAASVRVSAADARVEAARLAVGIAVTTAHAQAVELASTIEVYDTGLIPMHERVYDAVSEGYAAGRFGLLQLLDARRSLIDVRRARLSSVEALYQALVSIHTTLGNSAGLAALTAVGATE